MVAIREVNGDYLKSYTLNSVNNFTPLRGMKKPKQKRKVHMAKKKTARKAKRSGTVRITLVKGSEQSVQIKSGMTLEAFLDQQGETGARASVNGNEAKPSTKLRKGDIVLITPNVAGGR